MSDSRQTVPESLVNRAKYLGDMKSWKALARWSGFFIFPQAKESMGAGSEGSAGWLNNWHAVREVVWKKKSHQVERA